MKNKSYQARVLVLLGIAFVPLWLLGQIPAGYYDAANGLSGQALKTALHGIIDNHTELTYTEVVNALKVTDEDPNNADNVICFYTGWSYAKSNFGGGVSQWNREHTWSKSHGNFGTVPPEGTDLHHLKPTDVTVNSQKGNKDFDNGGTLYIDGDGPTGCYYTDSTWEPRDAVKGDVARIIFYMEVRYEGDTGELNLEMVDYVNSAPNGEPFYGKKSTLLLWHQNDTVDDFERNRNNIIYSNYQGNRNPFIDHPEYASLIWGGVKPEPTNHTANFENKRALELNWTDASGPDLPDGYLIKASTVSFNDIQQPTDGVPEQDSLLVKNVSYGVQTCTFNYLNPATTYYFKIFAYSNSGSNIDYKLDGTIMQSSATSAP